MSDSHTRTVRSVREVVVADPPSLVHPEWREEFPWLLQGTTTRGGGSGVFDLGLFSGGASRDEVLGSWRSLLHATGCSVAVHARQVHAAEVRVWSGEAASGVQPTLVDDCDGHATDRPGVLVVVTVADCVPVFLVDPVGQAVAAVHAGWRGAAAGVLEQGLDTLESAFGTRLSDLRVHLGPSICGACYEVGPEVFEALAQEVPDRPRPIDLRGVLAERAIEAGVRAERITISEHCTRCSDSGLFSHRGGDAHRQVGYLGLVHEGRR